ncbi:MAG: tyrosine-type recombinase/integrase [Bacteroidota bacterium]
MYSPITVSFFLKEERKIKGRYKVNVRIGYNRKKSEVITDIYTTLDKWNIEVGRPINDPETNQRISMIESEIFKIKEQLVIEGYEISSKLIKDVFTGKNKVQYGVVEFIDRFIETKKKDTTLSKTYFFKFSRLKKVVSAFISENYKTSDLMLPRVDYSFITSFNNYLKSQISEQYNKPLAPTTIIKRHTFFRTVLIQAYKEGFIKKQPYVDFKLRKIKTDIKYLTREELTILEEMNFEGHMQKSLDIFLFSVYTGLRFRDAQALTENNFEYINSKLKFITTIQEKTGDEVVIPIIKPTQRLLDKYKDCDDRLKYKRLIPKISNQKLNLYLKAVGQFAGIKLKLTHHVARHTCATTILLENNVPLEQVSKWLGHADISSTQVYAKITKSRLDTTASRINDLY